eukprot:g70099.t1
MNKGQSKQLDCGKGKLIHGKKGEEKCGEKEKGKEVKKESMQDKEPKLNSSRGGRRGRLRKAKERIRREGKGRGSRGPQGKYIFDARYGRELCCFPKALTKYGDFESGESCRFTDPENSQNQSSKVFGAWFVRTRADGYNHNVHSVFLNQEGKAEAMLASAAGTHVSATIKPDAVGQAELNNLSKTINRGLKEYIAAQSLLPIKHRPKPDTGDGSSAST